ncbi:hypothetical protein HanPI659440_Chr05g0214771 [Helianthus annuus]|nr:hypothetical protein HanPI659440_Chr05g0214771 [Helianthus annuus]
MGNSKLKANVARFAAENVGILDSLEAKGKRQPQSQSGKVGNGQFDSQVFVSNRGGKLFSELFKVGEKGVGSNPGGGEGFKSEGKVIEIPDNTQACGELNGKALVGRCINLHIINNRKEVLSGAGILDYSLSFLGGLSVLVKFSSVEECNSFIASYDRWKQWFTSLDHWMGQSLPFERLAWIKIYGVLIHLAVDEVFESIARQFGKVIQASQRTSEDVDLSVNCIGVLVGEGHRINNQIIIRWKDKSFRVWVEEDLVDWIPDCLSEEEPSGDDEVSSQFVFDDQDEPSESFKPDPKEGETVSPELHGNHRVHEGSVERESLGGCGNGSGLEVGERNNDDVSLSDHIPQEVQVQVSKEVGPLTDSGPISNVNGVFFFKSDIRTGPNKHKVRIRPRPGVVRHKEIRSPSSCERPQKRPMDSGTFLFDLNA